MKNVCDFSPELWALHFWRMSLASFHNAVACDI